MVCLGQNTRYCSRLGLLDSLLEQTGFEPLVPPRERTGVAEGAGLGLVRLGPGGGPICLRTALAHDLVVNAQTARRLGINILSEMIAKADWVVE